MERPYNSFNSWGPTYGEHKAYLEFSICQFKLLKAYALEVGILFTSSAMDIESLKQLYALNLPLIKIGSGDTNNIPMLKYAAANKEIPLFISTGMQTERTVRKVVSIMAENNKSNYCLMHCVSSYPTLPENANLNLIKLYRHWFPTVCLGYSGHEQGIGISAVAVLLGAKVWNTDIIRIKLKLYLYIELRCLNGI